MKFIGKIFNKVAFLIVLVAAVDLAWDLALPVKIPSDSKRYVVLSTFAKSETNELANLIGKVKNIPVLSVNKCGSGAADVNSLSKADSYAINALYSKNNQLSKNESINDAIENADTIIWIDNPKWISAWRSIHASIKSTVSVNKAVNDIMSPEELTMDTFSHGKIEGCENHQQTLQDSISIALNDYDSNREYIENLQKDHPDKFIRVTWPYIASL